MMTSHIVPFDTIGIEIIEDADTNFVSISVIGLGLWFRFLTVKKSIIMIQQSYFLIFRLKMTHQILHGVPYWNVFFEDARATKLVDLLTCNDFQTIKVQRPQSIEYIF